MTIAQLQSQLRFTARELVTEAQRWDRGSIRRRALTRAADQLSAIARVCRPGISAQSQRGAEALLTAGRDQLVTTLMSRAFTVRAHS